MMSSAENKRRTEYLTRKRKDPDALRRLCSNAVLAYTNTDRHLGNPEHDEILGVTKNWLDTFGRLLQELEDARDAIASYLDEDTRAIAPSQNRVYLNRKMVGGRLLITLHDNELCDE